VSAELAKGAAATIKATHSVEPLSRHLQTCPDQPLQGSDQGARRWSGQGWDAKNRRISESAASCRSIKVDEDEFEEGGRKMQVDDG